MSVKPFITVKNEKCRGCRRCEMACSWKPDGLTNPRLAGISIWKNEDRGVDRPVFNQNCLDKFCGKEHPDKLGSAIPLCVSTCLFGALTIEEAGRDE